MITFKKFITESLENPYTPIKISAGQFIAWCERNSPKYLERMGQNPIFRGFDAPKLGYINTNGMNRTSKNTINYYTIWMDNDKDWVDYPKRSKSLICSTSTKTAKVFGDVQIIVPADINKIGICSTSDLWESFPAIADRLDMLVSFMNMIVGDAHRFMEKFQDKKTLFAAQKNYDVLVDCLKSVTFEGIKEIANTKDYRNRFADRYVKAFEKHGYKTLYDLWRDAMQPEKNNFSVLTADEFIAPRNKEVWIQGECATVSYNYFKDGCRDENHPLYEFINKHNLRNVVE
jgi:hypothetical protein